MTIDVIDLCRENEIILFCLPPHTTHALQPLDVAVFKSLKDQYSKTVRNLTFAKPRFVVTKREFAKVVSVPFDRAFSIPNIKAGFAKTGIYPFNRDVVPKEKMLPSTAYGFPSPSGTGSNQTSSQSDQSTSGITHSTPISSSDSHYPATDTSSSNVSLSSIASSSSEVPSGNSSLPPAVTPSPVVSPIALQSSSGGTSSTVNPLVDAGLIPPHLADILSTPPVTKEPTKRITGARDLTAAEYYEWLKEEERKKKEKEEEKKRRSEERQRKREEKGKQPANKRAPSRKRQIPSGLGRNTRARLEVGGDDTATVEDEGTTTVLPVLEESAPCSSTASNRPLRTRQLPARFRDSDSEDDGILCAICDQKDPPPALLQ